jgi:hypothetical protein
MMVSFFQFRLLFQLFVFVFQLCFFSGKKSVILSYKAPKEQKLDY